MKRKCLIILLAAICAMLFAALLSGCSIFKKKEQSCSNHKFGEYVEVVAPTCYEPGRAEAKCSICGETKSYEIPPDHTYGELIVDVPVTCQANGSGHYICEVCNEWIDYTITSRGHNFQEPIQETETSCAEEGVWISECSRCGEKQYWYDAKLPHEFGEYVTVEDVTCTENGYKERTCANCGETERVNLIATGHKFEVGYTVDKEATCYENGEESSHCLNGCGETTSSRVIPAGHKFSSSWSYDGKYHWHEVLCEHGDLLDDPDIVKGMAKGEHMPSSSSSSYGANYCSGCRITHNFTIGLNYYELDDGTYAVMGRGRMRNSANIVIPDTVDGAPVTQIGYRAFTLLSGSDTTVKTVTLPSTLTVIGEQAFAYFSALQNVIIPEDCKITDIGRLAFNYCFELASADFPNTLTSIGDSAFCRCDKLENISFNNCNIGDGAFSYCTSLKTVTLMGENTVLGKGVFKNCTALKSVELPEGLTAILYEAFSCCTQLISVNIPSTITELGEYAFGVCSNLSKLSFPEGVTEIPDGAFKDCEKLASVSFAGDVTSIGERAFQGCGVLRELTVSDTWTSLGDYAFYNCARLVDITIPKGLEEISYCAFYGCTSLKTVTFNEGLTTLRNSCFYNCSALETLVLPDSLNKIEIWAIHYCTSIIELRIPEDVSISNSAFTGSSVKKVTAPASAINTLGSTFGIFAELEEITVTSGNSINCTFIDVTTLKKAVIPTLTGVSDYMFRGCTSLKEVILGDGLTTIGRLAFCDCALEELEVPDSVRTIGASALSGCGNLKKLTIPFVGSERNEVDDKCTLGYIFGPVSYEGGTTVKQYDEYSTSSYDPTNSYCIPSGLETVIVTNPNLHSGSFHGCKMIKNIEVRGDELYGSYIPAMAFSGCTGLESLVLPHYTTIEKGAFAETNFDLIEIPDDVTQIGDRAFSWCTGDVLNLDLPRATLGDYVFQHSTFKSANIIALYSTGASTFDSCKELESATFGKITTVGSRVFDYCENLKTIDFGDTVTRVNLSVFGYGNSCTCYNLNTLKFGKSFIGTVSDNSYATVEGLLGLIRTLEVVEISEENTNYSSYDGILYDYTQKNLLFAPRSLSGEVEIPAGVTSIASLAFYNRSFLEALTVPDGITRIGEEAFVGLTGLKRLTVGVENSAPLAASGCKNSLEQLYLHGGAVAAELFKGFKALKSVTFEGVTSIGDNAFENCVALSQINFNNGISQIGMRAFGGCNSLTNVELPDSVKTVYDPFENCTALESIQLSPNIKTLTSFAGCSSLKEIEIPANCSSMSVGVFADCVSLSKVTFLGSYLTAIPQRAFSGCVSIAEIDLPAGIRTIDKQAFEGCSLLMRISLPQTLTTINEAAFKDCFKMLSLTLPSSLTTVYTPSSNGNATDAAFYGCYRLYEICNLSSLPLSMGSSTYGGVARYAKNIVSDTEYTTIYAEDSARPGLIYIKSTGEIVDYRGTETALDFTRVYTYRSIGDYAFKGTAIESIILPTVITSIGVSAFENCTNLKGISLENVKTVKDSAFRNCTSLEKFSITYVVETIGDYAFYGCTALTQVTCDTYINNSKLTSIGDYSFAECTSLTKVSLPASLTTIGMYAFMKAQFTTITLPANFQTVSDGAFSECTNLTTISLPANLQTLGAGAFKGCTNLTTVNLPANIRSIKDETFYGCTNFTLPSSVFQTFTSIGRYAFADTAVSAVTLAFNVNLHSGAFAGTQITAITLPSELSYIPADLFCDCKLLTTVNFSGNKVESIDEYAFMNCESLTSITLPSSLKKLGMGAFSSSGLTSIVIPTSITEIGLDAFYACDALTEVTLGSVMSEYMFSHCTALQKINFGGVSVIPRYAFEECNGLEIVIIPETVTEIQTRAFYNCSSLSKVVIPSSIVKMESQVFTNYGASRIRLYCNITEDAIPDEWYSDWNYCKKDSSYTTYYLPNWSYNANGEPVG